MLAVIAGFMIPIVLSPFLVHGLRHLFAWFLGEGVELFLQTRITGNESMRLGLLLARANVCVVVLLWLAIFATRWLEMLMLITASVTILGVLIGLWISIEIVRHGLQTRGWTATQIGMLTFAGGNLPFIILAIVFMTLWR